MYILGIGPESLPTTLKSWLHILCSQLFFCLCKDNSEHSGISFGKKYKEENRIMNIVGQQVKRVDAYGKVTGEAKYTADLEPRDILHGRVVHSTIANGRVKSFDLT